MNGITKRKRRRSFLLYLFASNFLKIRIEVNMFKAAIVLLIIFCTYISSSLPDTFKNIDLYRINTDFNGSVYNGSILLVYGNGGVILKSSDIGNTWEQINLNDNLNIINMIYIGNQFVGLSD